MLSGSCPSGRRRAPSHERPTRKGSVMRASPPRRLLAVAVIVSGITVSLLVAVGASGRSATAPSLSQEPSISGTPIVGHTLKGNRGKWTGTAPLTYSGVWLRCDENAQSCNAISGATTQEYTIIGADVGSTLRFRVTAKNAEGSASADSNPTGVVGTASGVTVSSKPPVISGKAEVGSTLSTTTGTWVGNKPITFSYHWQRCDAAGNACNGISGANDATYALVGHDAGRTVRVKVSGTNSKGDGSAISEQTGVVAAAPGGGGSGGGGGGNSVDAGSLKAGDRLVVEGVTFSPNPVTSRS